MPGLPATGDLYAALLAAGAADPWQPDTAIPWEQPVRPPRWLPRRLFVRAVSQLHHGEMATAAVCRQLAAELEPIEPLAAACLRLQTDDETRHADVYRRYLERLGGIAPMDTPLATAIGGAAAAELSPVARTIAFHVVLEGEAVQLLQALARHIPCPLLTAIVQRTSRDEARHVAFGKRYVGAAIANLDDAERRALAEWIERLWAASCAELFAAYAGPFGALAGRSAANRRWSRHAKVLRRLGVPVRVMSEDTKRPKLGE